MPYLALPPLVCKAERFGLSKDGAPLPLQVHAVQAEVEAKGVQGQPQGDIPDLHRAGERPGGG